MKNSNRINFSIEMFIFVLLIILITNRFISICNCKNTIQVSQQSKNKSIKRPDESKNKLNQELLPQLTTKVLNDESLVILHTTQGDIKIKLFNHYAPLAVQNFLTHSQEGYYNDTTFYRIINNFVIQGGDPKSVEDNNTEDLGRGGKSIWAEGIHKNRKIDSGNGFKNEINNNLYNIRGSLVMANVGINTNGSQFFINQNRNINNKLNVNKYPDKIINEYKNGGNSKLDGKYTVFGQVINGLDVVDKIASAEVKSDGNGDNYSPKNPVKIKSIEILKMAIKND